MPLCEQCQENEALVFITQIIHGHVTKMAFCTPCAEAKGILPTGNPPTFKLPPELEAWGLPTLSREEVIRAMGMDPEALMAKESAEILDLPEDAPTEVTLPENMTVRELAEALHANWHQVVYVLMQHGKFTQPHHEIDFATASLVCEQFAVVARRA
ncbi:translation initiation factor IF-2 N-terminal domain-containing protein [Roseimicrobium sp. ORNL1]|uniref:translation initiation factor IF-2 N-terminal domain-containing protein n=1 Tax=Roseimicrobium sp. ORNL1 TaxID=2711231 RepID=UPI0013E206BE|nr:translation initiation factor IF-2 N-terminal domain-containing protein [Roseimicrobium sp. ORNL1]QIF00489.1 hypothetical protein G5S37_02775 [Roseimicrobium sp. ORNL1]